MNPPISEEDLQAYADKQLDATHLIRVEAWLAAHPERRADVDAWRAQSAALHKAYDALLDQAIPAQLMPAMALPRHVNLRWAAAIGWLALGGVVGFFLRGETTGGTGPLAAAGSLPHMAAVAHAVYTPEQRHPVEVGADQEAHLVGWLSKRLGATLKAPKLDGAGYALVGGRLLPGESREVAQFMYENAAHQRLTLYVRPNAPQSQEVSFRYARENAVDVFYWVDGHFGYALSGNTGREDMLALATLVYRQESR